MSKSLMPASGQGVVVEPKKTCAIPDCDIGTIRVGYGSDVTYGINVTSAEPIISWCSSGRRKCIIVRPNGKWVSRVEQRVRLEDKPPRKVRRQSREAISIPQTIVVIVHHTI